MSYQPEFVSRQWIDRMDYYSPDLSPLFPKFDSFDELNDWLKKPATVFIQLRQQQAEFVKKMRSKAVKQWSQLLAL